MKATRRNTAMAVTVFAMALPALAPLEAHAAGGIDVMKAGREDIGAFDQMLSKSQKPGAVDRSGIEGAVAGEARKARDERQRNLQQSKAVGQWTKGQKRPENKGTGASMHDDEGNGTGGKDTRGSSGQQTGGAGNGGGNGKGKGRN